jgi:hypothetical protein
MQTHFDITAERQRRYEQWSKAAPLFNACEGVATFLAWSFALRQHERATLAAVVVALGAFGAALVSAAAPLSWLAVAMGLVRLTHAYV